MKRAILKNKQGYNYTKTFWDPGDFAYISGQTMVQIHDKDEGQPKLMVLYLEPTMKHPKNFQQKVSRRILYPLRGKSKKWKDETNDNIRKRKEESQESSQEEDQTLTEKRKFRLFRKN